MHSISIILTIHNKESIIGDVLNSILRRTKSPFELVVVLDGCTDNSEKIVDDVLDESRGTSTAMTNFVKVHTNDVFQTKANNAGMQAASGDYFILTDDDVIIDEDGWEQRIIRPMMKFDDVFAVSGRGAHNSTVSGLHKVKQLLEKRICGLTGRSPNPVGVLGLMASGLWDVQKNPSLPRDVFAVRYSAIRSPIAYDANKMRALGYFDEAYAPYTWDDPDVCYRAYREHHWLSGAYIIRYISKPEWGTSRNKNTGLLNRTYGKNSKKFYERHKDLIHGPKHDENRILS